MWVSKFLNRKRSSKCSVEILVAVVFFLQEEAEKKQKSRSEHGIGKFSVPRNLSTVAWQKIGDVNRKHISAFFGQCL